MTSKLLSLRGIMYCHDISYAMRVDSCRKCGTGLEVSKKCDVCKEATQFYCHNCSNVSDKHIHAKCDLASQDQSLPNTTIA